ncbi:MAG TPA: hypothetical protein VF781_03375 [Solirubrobacteraceae bacterium]
MLDQRTGCTYTRLTSIEDWNREFSALVRRGAGEPDDIAPPVGEQAVENGMAASEADPDQAIAGRRLTIAARLVQLGFIAADRATPENPAVQVLSELLPPDAELGLCLTCHGFSSSAPYPFAETTGIFPNVGSFRMNPALAEVSPHGTSWLTAPRRELVVSTPVKLSWTASRVHSDRRDLVTLYSAQFRDIVGATVRHRRKGVVDVWIQDGPTLSFRVTPEAVDALQAHVDAAAISQ